MASLRCNSAAAGISELSAGRPAGRPVASEADATSAARDLRDHSKTTDCDIFATWPIGNASRAQRKRAEPTALDSKGRTACRLACGVRNTRMSSALMRRAQRVAVQAQQLGGADLIAARGRQRGRQQRQLDLADDAVIETGRRQVLAEAGEVAGEVALDLLATGPWRRRRRDRPTCRASPRPAPAR